MRKLFALMMVAVLSLTVALAVGGCGQRTEQTDTTTPPAEQTSMPMDSSAMTDSMGHMAPDTSMHQ